MKHTTKARTTLQLAPSQRNCLLPHRPVGLAAGSGLPSAGRNAVGSLITSAHIGLTGRWWTEGTLCSTLATDPERRGKTD